MTRQPKEYGNFQTIDNEHLTEQDRIDAEQFRLDSDPLGCTAIWRLFKMAAEAEAKGEPFNVNDWTFYRGNPNPVRVADLEAVALAKNVGSTKDTGRFLTLEVESPTPLSMIASIHREVARGGLSGGDSATIREGGQLWDAVSALGCNPGDFQMPPVNGGEVMGSVWANVFMSAMAEAIRVSNEEHAGSPQGKAFALPHNVSDVVDGFMCLLADATQNFSKNARARLAMEMVEALNDYVTGAALDHIKYTSEEKRNSLAMRKPEGTA